MAKLALIYGMRLLPLDDLGEVKEATVVLKKRQVSPHHHALDRRKQGRDRKHFPPVDRSIFRDVPGNLAARRSAGPA
jgi:hypothetical protein